MSAWLDPVGPHPPSVYWRRRAVTLAAAVLGVLVLTRACGSDQPPDLGIPTAASQTPVPLVSTYTPTPTPTSTSTVPTGTAPPGTEASGVAAGSTPGTQPTGDATAGAAAASGSAVSPGAAATPTTAQSAKPTECAQQDIEVTVRTDAKRYAAKANPKLFISVVNRGQAGCLLDVGSKALTLVVRSGRDRIWSSDDCQGPGRSDVRLLAPGKPFAAAAEWGRVRSAPGCPKGQPAAKPGTYLLSGSAHGVESARRAVFLLQ
jgi:hypothetical protein